MSQIDFLPVGDRVIVETFEQEELKTKSGIVISVKDQMDKELPQCGEVVALGTGGTFPDCPDPSKAFSIGDFVYFNRYAGEEVEIGNPLTPNENKKYTVLRLDAIFGKLGDKAVQALKDRREELRALAANPTNISEVDFEKPVDKNKLTQRLLDNAK